MVQRRCALKPPGCWKCRDEATDVALIKPLASTRRCYAGLVCLECRAYRPTPWLPPQSAVGLLGGADFDWCRSSVTRSGGATTDCCFAAQVGLLWGIWQRQWLRFERVRLSHTTGGRTWIASAVGRNAASQQQTLNTISAAESSARCGPCKANFVPSSDCSLFPVRTARGDSVVCLRSQCLSRITSDCCHLSLPCIGRSRQLRATGLGAGGWVGEGRWDQPTSISLGSRATPSHRRFITKDGTICPPAHWRRTINTECEWDADNQAWWLSGCGLSELIETWQQQIRTQISRKLTVIPNGWPSRGLMIYQTRRVDWKALWKQRGGGGWGRAQLGLASTGICLVYARQYSCNSFCTRRLKHCYLRRTNRGRCTSRWCTEQRCISVAHVQWFTSLFWNSTWNDSCDYLNMHGNVERWRLCVIHVRRQGWCSPGMSYHHSGPSAMLDEGINYDICIYTWSKPINICHYE